MKTARNVVIVILAAAIVGLIAFYYSQGATTQKQSSAEEGHEEAVTSVEMSDSKVAAAGIEILKAGPRELHDTLILNGILVANQESLLQVTPRFPGVVREIFKRVGDNVEKNEVLAKVESNQSLTNYDLRSSLAGTVIDRQIALGEYINEQKQAFTIADLSTVWVDFSVYRRDLRRVKLGDKVLIDPADGEPPVEATISYLAPVGSSDTQSALARAVVDNKSRRLRPGLFVSGKVVLSARKVPIAVSAAALQTLENRSVVFVRDGDKFEARDVDLGDRDAEWVEVLFGVGDGEQYAAKNSFIVKAEIGKAGASHSH